MIKISVFVYCAGLFIFYLMGSFSMYDSLPNWLYYLWDKSFGAGFFVWLTLYCNVYKSDRKIIAPIVFFSLIRFIWDIISSLTNVSVNNENVVAVLFILLLVPMYVLTLTKGNFLDKWLSKHLL